MPHLKTLLFVVGLLALVHAGVFVFGRSSVDTLLRDNIANAVTLLDEQDLELDSGSYDLYILPVRKRRGADQLDSINYIGKDDVWQTSRQAFYYPRGDCEDHAIVLADWLTMMGEDARVVIGEWKGGGHAWVTLFRDGNEYLLEATRKKGLGRNQPYPLASLFPIYRPRYMFNHESFWVNTGALHGQSYSDPARVEASHYTAYED